MRQYLFAVFLACMLPVVGGCDILRDCLSRPSQLEREVSLTNLKMIGLAMLVYRDSAGGRLPCESGAAGLSAIGRDIYQAKTFVAPFDHDSVPSVPPLSERNTSYAFIAGGDRFGAGDAIRQDHRIPAAIEKPWLKTDGRIGVLFLDGHVASLEGEFSGCEEVVSRLRDENAAPPFVWDALSRNARNVDRAGRE